MALSPRRVIEASVVAFDPLPMLRPNRPERAASPRGERHGDPHARGRVERAPVVHHDDTFRMPGIAGTGAELGTRRRGPCRRIRAPSTVAAVRDDARSQLRATPPICAGSGTTSSNSAASSNVDVQPLDGAHDRGHREPLGRAPMRTVAERRDRHVVMQRAVAPPARVRSRRRAARELVNGSIVASCTPRSTRYSCSPSENTNGPQHLAEHDRTLPEPDRLERAVLERRVARMEQRLAASVHASAANRLVIVAMCSSTTSPAIPGAGSSTSSQRRAMSSRKLGARSVRSSNSRIDVLDACERGAFVVLRRALATAPGWTNASAPSRISNSATSVGDRRFPTHPTREPEPMPEAAREVEHVERSRVAELVDLGRRSPSRDCRGNPAPPPRRRGRARTYAVRRTARPGACARACGSRRCPCSRRAPRPRRTRADPSAPNVKRYVTPPGLDA